MLEHIRIVTAYWWFLGFKLWYCQDGTNVCFFFSFPKVHFVLDLYTFTEYYCNIIWSWDILVMCVQGLKTAVEEPFFELITWSFKCLLTVERSRSILLDIRFPPFHTSCSSESMDSQPCLWKALSSNKRLSPLWPFFKK